MPLAREVAIDVSPAELADPAALERMRHRVRIKRIGRAWLRGDALPINDGGGDDGELIDQILPAIGETANRIRVVVEEDDARVAVWIERRDAWESIVAPSRFVGDHASPVGVWLEAGAPIRVIRGAAIVGGGGQLVELRDEAVDVRVAAPGAFVGHVWIVPHDDRTQAVTATAMAMAMASGCTAGVRRTLVDRSGMRSLGEGTVIREVATEAAQVLATLLERLDVAVVARGESFTLVELQRPYARIRGYVPSLVLEPAGEDALDLGTCGMHSFGMSHADRIEVPAGACLFDRASGEVIGTAIKAKVRLGARARAGDAWSMVYVDTRWSVASLYVHDTGRDPAQPVLESCAASQHRR